MGQLTKSRWMTALLAVAISAPATWYLFVYLDADPYNLGIESAANVSLRILSSDGRTISEETLGSCRKSSGTGQDLTFAGATSTLTLLIDDRDTYPLFDRTAFRIGGPVSDALAGCEANRFFISRSQRRSPGRSGGVPLSFSYSGDFSITCKGVSTPNTYVVDARFRNCRF